MHEYIITAIILGYKAITFRFVKPLYSTCSHIIYYLDS
jgi:hypothetical protein